MLSASSPSRKPSFRSTNTNTPPRPSPSPSPLQRTTSSRDIESLSPSSPSPSPSPSAVAEALSNSSQSSSESASASASTDANASSLNNGRGSRSRRVADHYSSSSSTSTSTSTSASKSGLGIGRYSSLSSGSSSYDSPPRPRPSRSHSHSHSRLNSSSSYESLRESESASRTPTSPRPTGIRPPSPHPSYSSGNTGTRHGKENGNTNANADNKYLYTNSRIPTPTPKPTSPPSSSVSSPSTSTSTSASSPRSPQQPQPRTPNRRITVLPRSSRSSSSSKSSSESSSPGKQQTKVTYAELISAIVSLCSPSASLSSLPSSSSSSSSSTTVPSQSSPRTTPPSPSTPVASSSTASITRPRVPSRTQPRHASAARRLSAEGLHPTPVTTPPGSDNNLHRNKNTMPSVFPDDPRDISNVPTTPSSSIRTNPTKPNTTTTTATTSASRPSNGPKKDGAPDSRSPSSGSSSSSSSSPSWTGLRSLSHSQSPTSNSNSDPEIPPGLNLISNAGSKTSHLRRPSAGGGGAHATYSSLKRKQIDPAPDVGSATPPPPYLWKTLEVAKVGMIAESANMGTLMSNREVLKASYITPQSILDKLNDSDNYYHVWVAVKLALEEKPYAVHGMEEVVKLAFTKLLIELGGALNDCLSPNLPHYTFVDPRKLMHPEGMQTVLEQAIAIVEGLEKKGMSRDRIYISIPATETGLAIAKKLKEDHKIKTNLTFVSNLAQASVCAAAGAAAITMPVDKILTYHEFKSCLEYDEMKPHPGWQDIKSTASYVKHHNLEMEVIGSGWRSLEELEHCASLTSICLSDTQIVPARWHRTRINRPPGPSSHITSLAQSTPYPPHADKFSEDARGIRYISQLESTELRNQCAEILHAGMRSWQEGAEKLFGVICWEVGRQMYLWVRPRRPCDPLGGGQGEGENIDVDVDQLEEIEEPLSPKTRMMLDLEQYERSRLSRSQSVQRWGEPRTSYSISAFGSPSATGDGDGDSAAVMDSRYVETRRRTQRQRHHRPQNAEHDQDEDALQEIQIEFPQKEGENLHSEWDAWDDEEVDERVRRYHRGKSVASTSASAGSVPPSPYWTDADTFENEGESMYYRHDDKNDDKNECGSTSSSSDDDEDMIMVA